MPKAYEAMRDKFAQGGGEKGQPEVQRGAEQGGGDLQRQAPEAPREEQGAVTLSEPGTVIPWKRKLPKDADVYERLRTKTVHLTPEIAVHESYLGTVVEDLKDFPKENIWDFSDENTSVLARHMNKIDRRRGIGSDNTLQATRMLEDAYGNRVRKAIEERESIPVRMFDDWESGLEDATKAGYIREGDLYVFKPETPPDKGEVL